MPRPKVRVILASEYPEVRRFLRGIVEEEADTAVVGQADNAIRALSLARNLRPDVAIIDCYLPHAVGLDDVPLSRVSGLDTAQTISQEVPNTRAIMVTNLDRETLPEAGWAPGVVAFFSRQNRESTPFTLQELFQETAAGSPIFANIEVKRRASLRQKLAAPSDKAILFGGLTILGGLLLLLSVILAGAGVFLALAGGVTLLLGLIGKLVLQYRPRQGKAR